MIDIKLDDYQPPFWLFNGHLQTIVPSQFRSVRDLTYTREIITTPDDDFLLLDWAGKLSDKLVVISHGLEGDSYRPYIKGMARAFVKKGYQALAWNFRGCGGQINKNLRFYHSGATDDLDFVVNYAISQNSYKKIVLVGFSLGGNLTLKFLGEHSNNLDQIIASAITFSVPVDLHSSSNKIGQRSNLIYSQRFIRNLKKKIAHKMPSMPHKLTLDHFDKIKTLKDFDEHYTAPIHGFTDAEDYYKKCSSLYFLEDIKVPTLIVNAKNDPFLADECYPYAATEHHPFVKLCTPSQGGHVGFMPRGVSSEGNYWSEDQAVHFAQNH